MGAATSYQSGSIIVKAVNNISAETVQNAITDSSQSVEISATNVNGDVRISGNTVTQTVNVSLKSIYDSMTKTDISDKINTNIEQQVRHMLSGLNLAQISASAETFQQIIENLITIKNTGINNCKNNSNQNVKFAVSNVNGSVKITKNVVKQSFESISDCILSSQTNTDLIRETDTKIKQLTSATVQGIDPTVAIAAGIGAFGLVFLGGLNMFKNSLGPLLIAAGSGVLYFKTDLLKEEENASETFIFYNENFLDDTVKQGLLKRISKEPVTKNKGIENKQPSSVDVVELYENTLLSYKLEPPNLAKNLVENLKQFRVDSIKSKNIEVTKEPTTNIVSVNFKNSKEKFRKINTTITLTDQEVLGQKDLDKNADVVWNYNSKTHSVDFFRKKSTNTKNPFSKFNKVKISQTIVRVYNVDSDSASSKSKKPFLYIGVGLILTGVVVLLTSSSSNSFRGNKNSRFVK